jgi:predicted restriction endonuclease
MENQLTIKIDGYEYYIIDSIQNLRAEDSFIHKSNKLQAFVGSGEARKYIGGYSGDNYERISKFFDYTGWGEAGNFGSRMYPVIVDSRCLFSKSNLMKYLFDTQLEHSAQEQVYQSDISKIFEEKRQSILELPNEITYFSIYDVSDRASSTSHRAYIRSDDNIWKIWRKLVLPKISYLSILKLLPISSYGTLVKPLFFFRIFVDYQFRSIVHPSLELNISPSQMGVQLGANRKSYNRIGGDSFRKSVIDHMPQCPFTKISDEKLLVASHIKPYSICIKEGRQDQALDYLNGLALTPTFDKLFDQGYITFTDTGELICGTLLTAYTWEKLNVNPRMKNRMRIYPEKRSEYLEFHRNFVFQDSVSDLMCD